MEHSFNIDVAKEYGVIEAVIIRNFQYWILLNKANKKHFHDGHYWTYNSRAAMLEIFPYLSEQSLKTALSHIIKNGVLITGNYNENKYDRTNWYAFYDEGKWIGENQLTDWLKSTNQSVEINQPIPNNNTNNNTNNNNPLTFLSESKPLCENKTAIKTKKRKEDKEKPTKENEEKTNTWCQNVFSEQYKLLVGETYLWNRTESICLNNIVGKLVVKMEEQNFVINEDAKHTALQSFLAALWNNGDEFVHSNFSPHVIDLKFNEFYKIAKNGKPRQQKGNAGISDEYIAKVTRELAGL